MVCGEEKMIPKTKIRFSWIYNIIFNSNFSKEEFFKLKKDCIKFEKFYCKHIKEILKLMEKHHSKDWKYKFIPIYIVKDSPSSFSDPLTLKYRKNEKYLLIVLAHELLHNNMGKKKFKSRKELHIYMELILDKIILGMSVNLKKELGLFNKKIKESYHIK